VVTVAQCFSLPLVVPSLFSMALLAAQKPAAYPVISVNYPTLKGDRFVTLTLDGFQQHKLTVNLGGAPGQLTAVLFDDFLSRAGWNHLPDAEKSKYLVHVEGAAGDHAEFPLENQRVWLMMDPLKPQAELIELNEHGSITRKVPGIRTIRVLPDSIRKN
jgi:hypothetical protein